MGLSRTRFAIVLSNSNFLISNSKVKKIIFDIGNSYIKKQIANIVNKNIFTIKQPPL